MSLLRIRISLLSPPLRCEWALIQQGHQTMMGNGPLAELPKTAEQVQLILPASQVLITRASVPQTARRNAGSVLAYAIEDETISEPDTNQVNWLGNTAVAQDVLTVIDKVGLTRWQQAIEACGIHDYEIHCETLMLPYTPNEWSLAWMGCEGFIRTGKLEGAATDCGDVDTAPLSLHLMLEAAKAHNAEPQSIAIYRITSHAAPDAKAGIEFPDIKQWTQNLGMSVRIAGTWDWRTAPSDAGVSLIPMPKRWRAITGIATRLRPAAWILCAALIIHGSAIVLEWSSLANEQRSLRQGMEAQFRSVFPDAVAVTDPALQMRRKLSEMRNVTGQSDSSHFLPMIEQIAAAVKELPAGTIRTVAYENGRMTVELSNINEENLKNTVIRLTESGMHVEVPPNSINTSGTAVLTIRSS